MDYVSPVDQDFIRDVEEREKAGTPGVLQTLKAALAIEVKARIGVERIEAREHELLGRAFARWAGNERIEILGNPDPKRRIGIVSFNLRDARGRYLHPKFVTVLLNDLFGIQSRAGCSCAGPYGHRLLGIDQPTSELYRDWVRKGFQGIKPGWCRVGFHYSMDDLEAGFIMDAVEFVAAHGPPLPAAVSRSTRAPACGAIANTRKRTRRSRWTRRSRHRAATRPRCLRRHGRRYTRTAWPRRDRGPNGWESLARARRLSSSASGSCASSTSAEGDICSGDCPLQGTVPWKKWCLCT